MIQTPKVGRHHEKFFWSLEEQLYRLRPFFPKSRGKPRVDDRRVEPCRVCRQLYSGWLNLPEVGAVRDHAVEHAEQLSGRRGQSGFHWFSCLLQLLPERSERRRVTGRMQGGEIEDGPDGCPPATDDPSSVALAAIPGNRRKAGESSDLSAIGCADLRQLSHECGGDDRAHTGHRLQPTISFGQFGRAANDLCDPCLDLLDPPLEEQDQALDVGPGIAVCRLLKSGHLLLSHLNQLTAPGNLREKRLPRR